MTFVSFGVPKVAKVGVLESLLTPFWRLFGLWVGSENGALACTRAQSRRLEGVRNHTNFGVF